MQPAENGNRDELGCCCWWRLSAVGDRCIASEPLMWSLRMVVLLDEFLDESVEMPVVERNDVVQQLAAQSAEEAFDEWILPGTPVCSAYLIDATCVQKGGESAPKDPVVITEHEPRL